MPSELSTLGPQVAASGHPIWFVKRERSWVNTPGYWSVNKSSLPINPYSDQKWWVGQNLGVNIVRDNQTGVTTTTYVGYGAASHLEGRHNNLNSWLDAVSPSDSGFMNEAQLKALVRLGDLKAMLPVTVAEARKTSDMILRSAERIYNAGRAVRRGDFREVERHLNSSLAPWRNRRRGDRSRKGSDSFQSDWLQLQYGWLPVLQEVKGVAEFFAQRNFGRKPRLTSSGKVVFKNDRKQKVYDPSYSPGSWWEEYASKERTFTAKIWAEIDNPYLTQYQQLGLTNPALVAWELVPFSFVFDWFISVGDWLQGISAVHGISVRRAFTSRAASSETRYISTALPQSTPDGNSTKSGYHFKFTGKGRSYDRASWSVNPLELYPPVNTDPFNFRRLVNGLALLSQQARRL